MVDVGVGVVVVAATVARTRWAPTTGGAERVSFQFRMTTLAQMGACRKPQQPRAFIPVSSGPTLCTARDTSIPRLASACCEWLLVFLCLEAMRRRRRLNSD